MEVNVIYFFDFFVEILPFHYRHQMLCFRKRIFINYYLQQYSSQRVIVFTQRKLEMLPPTNPGMPMYMDSPGYPVTTADNTITVVVPHYRINNQQQFQYDGVTAFMKVNTSDEGLPLLGVYEVYSVASGDLSLPYQVKN